MSTDAVAFNGTSTYVMLSNGAQFGTPMLWSNATFQGTRATLLGDVSGDGAADAIAVNATSTWTMLSQ